MSRWKDRPTTQTDLIPGEKWRSFVFATLLTVGSLLVYGQATQFGYMTIDDHAYVTENQHVKEGLTLEGIAWSFTSVHDANWIPFTWLSLMLDSDIYGVRPGGYHFTNILLHTANTLLLFAVLAAATQSLARSAFVAALFALHPLHVESVAWIAERKDVLSTFFGLASLLAYVCYAVLGRRRYLVGSFLLLAASLLAKQTLVTLPFVFLLLDFWPLGRWNLLGMFGIAAQSGSHESAAVLAAAPAVAGRQRSPLSLVVEKLPFFAAILFFSAAATFAQSHGGAVRALQLLPVYAREMNAVSARSGNLLSLPRR
jgi:protein O-mannosyl-transferase